MLWWQDLLLTLTVGLVSLALLWLVAGGLACLLGRAARRLWNRGE